MNYSGLYNKKTFADNARSLNLTKIFPRLVIVKNLVIKYIHLTIDYANQFGQNIQDYSQPHVEQIKKVRFSKPHFDFGNKFSKFKKYLTSKNLAIGIGLIVVFLVVMVIARALGGNDKQNSQVAGVSDNNSQNIIQLNKKFNFPLTDSTGEEVSSIEYEIESAELTDDIFIQGQPTKPIAGRTFLVLSLKVTNDYQQDIEIDTGDYIRVKLDVLGDELLAADMDNDPMKVQAISTKYSRLGYSIPKDFGNIKLLVGEISGDKEELTLEF